MIVNALNNVNFKGALTTAEKQSLEKLVNSREVSKQLGLGYGDRQETIAIVPSFSMLSSKFNTGIGTLNSDSAQDVAEKLKSFANISAIQTLPAGEISGFNKSPYDSTNFSYGAQNIDLAKLTTPDYGYLLTDEQIENSKYVSRASKEDDTNVQYGAMFSADGLDSLLRAAYANFKRIPETSSIKQDFEAFKAANPWAYRDALFEAEVEKNGGERDFTKWESAHDRDLFKTAHPNQNIIKGLECEHKDAIEYAEFIQFIADKQAQEAKAAFNAKGIKVYADIPIGFSQKDIWAHQDAFYHNFNEHKFGVKDDSTNDYNCWSPAVDFNKLKNFDGSEGPAAKLLREKFQLAFKRYDGVRVDAAWQLMEPVVVKPYTHNANKGNHAETKYIGNVVLQDIIMDEADKAGVAHDRVFLELLGGNSWNCLDDAKKTGANLIHITRYANDGWGRVKYYEQKAPQSAKYQNMASGSYIIGLGTHDDNSAVEQATQGRDRIGLLANDLKLNRGELESPKARLKAMFAELFTTKKQFITLPDILGSERRINTPNVISSENWSYRINSDYEQEYHQNLTRGKGLNLPDAISKAIKAKNNGQASELTRKLDRYAEILSNDDGVYTQKDADIEYGSTLNRVG